MNPLRAIIVDDEQAARAVLKKLLRRSGAPIDVICTCANLEEGVQAIRTHRPQVVFLDVQMPNYMGYEIASFFDQIDFEIIFVTAFDQYAIKAFELSAVDYLVKPIDRLRLSQAIEKVTDKVHKQNAIADYQVLLENMKAQDLGSMVIPEIGGKRVLKLSNIIAIEANGAYSIVHLKGEAPLTVSKNLKQLEDRLPEGGVFFRSHKSWIINSNEMVSYHKTKGEIIMSNDLLVRLSKHRLDEFKKLEANIH